MDTKSSLYKKIPDVANGLPARRWLRWHAFFSTFSHKIMPPIGDEYLAAVQALDDDGKRKYRNALIVADENAAYFTDTMGVAALPVFLGLVMVFAAFDPPIEVLTVYLAGILVYLLLYIYYRRLKAITASLLRVADII